MSASKVVVVRSGGFANMRRTVEVDDPRTAEQLADAVEHSAPIAADGRTRDAFTYEIVVVTASDRRSYALTESQLPVELRSRLQVLLTAAHPDA